MRKEHLLKVAASLHFNTEIAVTHQRRVVEPIKRKPGPAVGRREKDIIRRAVRVNPDEGFGRNAQRAETVKLGQTGTASGVDRNAEPGRHVRQACGVDEFCVHRAELGRRIDPALDEPRTDAGFLDPFRRFTYPPGGELPGGLSVGIVGQEAVLTGAIQAGVGDQPESGFFAQSSQKQRIPTQKSGGALKEGAHAQLTGTNQVGSGHPRHGVALITRTRDLIGADEVDQHVLMRERKCEVLR